MLTSVFWDVQHGSATYIKTPSGRHIVIDLGTGSYGNNNLEFSPLLHLKHKWNVTKLDGVIITHPHRDHLDDIYNFESLSPQLLTRPKHLSEDDIKSGNPIGDNGKIEKYLEINARYKYPVIPSDDIFLEANNGGVKIQFFTPKLSATSNLNNHSIVTVILYENIKIIIPGDNEPPSWNELLEHDDFILAIKDADILVAPHHGRQSGFSSKLFEYINPKLTIISDGPSGNTSATDLYSHVKPY